MILHFAFTRDEVCREVAIHWQIHRLHTLYLQLCGTTVTIRRDHKFKWCSTPGCANCSKVHPQVVFLHLLLEVALEDCRGVLIRWNGLVEWNSGMEYWNGGMLQRAYLIKIIIQLWCLDSVDLWNGNILESKI